MIVVFYFRLTPNLMVQSNFVMPSSDCTAQKRNQLLSCNSTEKRVPLAEMAASLTLRLFLSHGSAVTTVSILRNIL